jgi:hypothetical protein
MKPTHSFAAPARILLLGALLVIGAHAQRASVATFDRLATFDRDGAAQVNQTAKDQQPFDRRYTDFVYRLILEVMHFLNDNVD